MKGCLKLLSLCFLTVSFLINSSTPYMASDTLCAFLESPCEVEKNKSFTVSLQAECSTAIGAVMFTIEHSDNVEYSECRVNDSDFGYIEKVYSNNRLSIIYVNTAGIVADQPVKLVDITFKAYNAPATAYFKLYTSNCASSDEKPLISDSEKEYSINIVEMVADTQSASEAELKNNPIISVDCNENSSSEASAVNKSIPDNKSDLPSTPVVDEITVVSSIDIAESGDIKLFVAGTVFAVAVLAVIGISYSTGKKKANVNIDKNK